MPRYDVSMDDAQARSEHARTAANARWTGQVVSRAAETVVDRADELDDDQAEDVMRAVARGPFAAMLPARSLRAIAAEDREERRQAREAERSRAERAEERHNRALAVYQAQAAERGEQVSALDLISGQAGRTVADVFADAKAMAEATDAREAARVRRAEGSAGYIPYPVAPPALALGEERDRTPVAARSDTAMEMANRRRHFEDRRLARRKADELDGRGPVYLP
jgi:hypothetical protein